MGLIQLMTGNGGGKTTSALGIGLRASGHGQKVVIIQFLKGRKDIGEYRAIQKIKNIKIYQFGRRQFVKKITDNDEELAEKGLEFAKKQLKKEPNVLILDEINIAASMGLLDENEIIQMLNKVPKKTTVIMTGRKASKKLMQKADIVTEVKDIKRPKTILTRKGIEY